MVFVIWDPTPGDGRKRPLESWEQYSGYVWSGWTTKVVQPVHIDPALQAMIDQSTQPGAAAAGPPSHISTQSTSSTAAGFKGSYTSAVTTATPFPDSVEDVTMESVADKRTRESPDSTLKPEGKSLKTSGVASATLTEGATFCARTTKSGSTDEVQDSDPKAPVTRWKARDVAEARLYVRQMQQRVPAWKLKLCTEALHTEPIGSCTHC